MANLLIVENEPSDLRTAAEATRLLGITNVQARTSANAAKIYLEAAMEGRESIPDVVVLDLDLGYDSGFELLRLWHSEQALNKAIRMIVWTALGEEQQEICRLFKVDAVVPKNDGIAALKQAIERITAKAS